MLKKKGNPYILMSSVITAGTQIPGDRIACMKHSGEDHFGAPCEFWVSKADAWPGAPRGGWRRLQPLPRKSGLHS